MIIRCKADIVYNVAVNDEVLDLIAEDSSNNKEKTLAVKKQASRPPKSKWQPVDRILSHIFVDQNLTQLSMFILPLSRESSDNKQW